MNQDGDLSVILLQVQLGRDDFALDVELTLPSQGVTVLFGPSGSGKTSCLRVLAGLERSAQGRVAVGDLIWQDSARGLFVPPHRRGVGYVFQEASLFEHLTVEGNLRFGFDRTPPAQRRNDWHHDLDRLGIGHLLRRWPHELSGGERQRVAIARALAAGPRLLLMDEPLAALDAVRKAEILTWLEQLHQTLDIPVIYVTHSADEVAQLADHVVILDHGRVMAQGSAIELMARTDLPFAHGDSAGALVEAVICRLQDEDGLCVLRFDGGTLLVPQTFSTPLPENTPVRIRIQARDVSLSLVYPEQTSVLNCLRATVTDISDNGLGQVLVGLRLGACAAEGVESENHPQRDGTAAGGLQPTILLPHRLPGQQTRLLARITSLSCHRLGIAPGLAVYAQIKGVALVR